MSLTAWDTEAGWLNDSGLTLAQLCTEAQNPAAVGPDWYSLIAGDIRVVNR